MNPTRWSKSDMTEFERTLLDAARDDQVPEALRAHMEQVLHVGSTSMSSGLAASKFGGSLLAKMGLWGTLSAGLVAATATWFAMRPAPVDQLSVPATQITQPHTPAPLAVPPAESTPHSTGTLAPEPNPTQASELPASARQAKNAPDEDSLRAEVELLVHAREALQRGATARALQLLKKHHQQFENGAMVPEAEALHIEALISQGSIAAAKAKTEQFLRAYPSHPLRAHVMKLNEAGAETDSQASH